VFSQTKVTNQYQQKWKYNSYNPSYSNEEISTGPEEQWGSKIYS
jgi:hypothetical protein